MLPDLVVEFLGDAAPLAPLGRTALFVARSFSHRSNMSLRARTIPEHMRRRSPTGAGRGDEGQPRPIRRVMRSQRCQADVRQNGVGHERAA